MLVIKAGKLIDGTGRAPLEDVLVLIERDKIVQVGKEGAVLPPADAEVIDASDKVVMPGLIDAHLHVNSGGGFQSSASRRLAKVTELIETTTLRSYVLAKQDLMAGATTIRDMGAAGYSAVALRDAIEGGLVTGPRMRACGQGLSITDGHMDGKWRPGVTVGGRTGVADSPWAFRRATRHQIKMGADCIKINACSSAHRNRHTPDEPFWQEMTFEEMKAVCDEAHKAHLRVAAHTSGGQGITDAILAGVDSLEHAHWITDEQADLMAEHGTFYVPTFIVVAKALEMGQEALGYPDERWGYLTRAMDVKARSLERARKAGVKIAAGTDAGARVCHGENARELEELVRAGMTPMEAILSATSVGAHLLDMADLVGSIEPDKLADILIVDGDPLGDICVLRDMDRIKMVIKGGEVVVQRD
jgi:imidazolonepropionase-like amidohydrolase